MNTEAPLQVFQLVDRTSTTHLILMSGTFRWELEYEALTGASYQQAVFDLDSQLTEYRNATKEKRVPIYSGVWARCTFDLFYASTAKWRSESGWDRTRTRPEDEGKPERQCTPYITMVEAMGKTSSVAMQGALIRLLYAYNFDPSPAAHATNAGKVPRPKRKLASSTTS